MSHLNRALRRTHVASSNPLGCDIRCPTTRPFLLDLLECLYNEVI